MSDGARGFARNAFAVRRWSAAASASPRTSSIPRHLNVCKPPQWMLEEGMEVGGRVIKSRQASPALAQAGAEGDMRPPAGAPRAGPRRAPPPEGAARVGPFPEGPAEGEKLAFFFQNTVRKWSNWQ